jgi:DNA mismatch endonuclease (patch repair protein)
MGERTPAASDDATRRRMTRQRRRDTAPELAIRRNLHARGLRYRVDAPLPATRRRADLLFPGPRIAVFIDGCFWHGCPAHATTPKRNTRWWVDKIAANVARDHDTDRRLQMSGWLVLRIWEHESADAAAEQIAAAVAARRVPHTPTSRRKGN